MKSPAHVNQAANMACLDSQSTRLRCDACGNDTRFIEVMEYVENRVDGDRNHLHLLIGIPDSYFCEACGARIAEDT
ncbi:MAG: hypothetical protein H0U23_06705 [Blastocatellia bacterium]|nr:hypothetical protein [Blastocatellia bacterium]